MINNMKDAFSVKGKNVLVSGGNRGIGKGIVQAFAQSEANVAIMARDEEAARSVLKDINKYGGKYIFYKGDVKKKEDCEMIVRSVNEDFGKLDILVNNAGIDKVKDTFDLGPDFKDWYDVIDVNLNGLFLMCYYAGKSMKKQGGGSIINISSMSAYIVCSPQWESSYSASKAAVAHLTESLGAEWAPYNIRVNAVAPGYTYSPMFDEIQKQNPKWLDHWKNNIPTGRFLTPIEVGAMCVFLGSEAADYLRGCSIMIDGGLHIPR